MQLFGISIWFFAFIATALVLCFSLAHNITNGAKLRTALLAELAVLKGKFETAYDAARAATPTDPKVNPNAASTGLGSSRQSQQ